MRLIHRHRSQRPKALLIPITQAEIEADLRYPATRRPGGRAASAATGGPRR